MRAELQRLLIIIVVLTCNKNRKYSYEVWKQRGGFRPTPTSFQFNKPNNYANRQKNIEDRMHRISNKSDSIYRTTRIVDLHEIQGGNPYELFKFHIDICAERIICS